MRDVNMTLNTTLGGAWLAQEVYSGMVIGENSRPGDMEVNIGGLCFLRNVVDMCRGVLPVASSRSSDVGISRREVPSVKN